MNATENIRGINYRLCKAPPPPPPQPSSPPDYLQQQQQHTPHGITPPPPPPPSLSIQSIYVSQMFPFYTLSYSPSFALSPAYSIQTFKH